MWSLRMKYFRIVLETILPPNQRTEPAQPNGDHAVDQQFPVSEWLDVGEWYRLAQYIRRVKKVEKYGLILGHQTKEDGKPFDKEAHEAVLADIKADVFAHLNKRDVERFRLQANCSERIDAFVRSLDMTAYGLNYALGSIRKF